jgi:adenosylcobinamide-GDP ribazoletransferase
MTAPPFARRIAELRLAFMLLSRLPVGRLAEPAPPLAAAIWAFPVVGAAVGALGAGAFALGLAAGVPVAVAAGLALGVQVAATGALHEDGLADVADGFWGGRTPQRRLEIMRDSRIGSYGTIALVLALGLRWAAIAAVGAGLGAGAAAAALVAAGMSSRAAPAVLLALLPPARADGLGRAAGAGASRRGAGVAALIAALPVLAVPGMFAALLAQAAAAAGIARLARARIGGQTGDVLGASQQAAEIAALVCLAAAAAG